MHTPIQNILTKDNALKKRRDCQKHILVLLITLVTVCWQRALAAELQYTNEYWISTNTSGSNLGTLDNPFIASTETQFLTLMNRYGSSIIPPYSKIHLMPGVYYTDGYGSMLNSGWKLSGSGIDVTIIQLATNAPGHVVIYGTGRTVTNVEVSDLTVDGHQSATSTNAVGGLYLNGTDIAVRRVKAINLNAYYSEEWAITIGPGSLPDSTGNRIEECEVTNVFESYATIDGIDISGGSGTVRDNKIILPGGGIGINGEGSHDYIVEGNYIYGAWNGVHIDTGGTTNLMVINNSFVDCDTIASLGGLTGGYQNMTFAFNRASLKNDGTSIFGFTFGGGPFTNIFIFGNTVSIDGPLTSGNCFVAGDDMVGLTIANNSFDNRLTNAITPNCQNVAMYNNSDLVGDYLTDANIPTVGNTVASELGLNLIGSTTVSEVLTNLGLPTNIASVVTNQQFFISAPDAVAIPAGSSITVSPGCFTGGAAFPAWVCPSNNSVILSKAIPLPNDFWGGKLSYVSSWSIRTTNSGNYSFTLGTEGNLPTNDLATVQSQTITFTAPSGTNTTIISATNTISTTNVNELATFIYTGNQVQPANYFILSGKVTAQ